MRRYESLCSNPACLVIYRCPADPQGERGPSTNHPAGPGIKTTHAYTRYIDDRCIMMHLENLDFKNISIKPSTSINTHLGNRRIWHLPHSPLWRPAGGWKADLDIRDVDAKHPWGTQQTGDMNWLVVCVPPEKIWKSDWIIIPTLGENKTCSKPPASEWWNMTNRHWIQVWRKQTPGFWRIHLRVRLNLYPVLSVITEIAG